MKKTKKKLQFPNLGVIKTTSQNPHLNLFKKQKQENTDNNR